MNRSLVILSFAIGSSLAFGQSTGQIQYDKSIKALSEAKALSVTYTVQMIGGAPSSVSIDLAKPNLARIETSKQIIVSDGKTTTTYDKTANTFYKTPTTAASIVKLMSSNDLSIWAPFFDSKAIKQPSNIRALGAVKRKGMTLQAFEFTLMGKAPAVVTYYVGVDDNIIRQAQVVVNKDKSKETTIIDTKALKVLSSANSSLFVFHAPTGSRELSEAERNAAKWYNNLDEALAVAKSTNKLVLVDFYTGWCHWCKVLREEVFPKDEFKAMGKYFVFCEIDAEAEPSIAQKYGVNAYPTSVFVNSDGTMVHKLEGYKPLNEYLAEMETARKAGGL
jgi:thioredoxin-related protein